MNEKYYLRNDFTEPNILNIHLWQKELTNKTKPL
jgi:hypothetical protein